MFRKYLTKNNGFTLIEIVLVLALAALILAIVFVALSGANRARRDTARKNDAARMLAAIESCASNNQGLYSSCTTQAQLIGANYFSGNAPDGSSYSIAGSTALNVFTVTTAACAGGSAPAAVRIKQEAGADFCVDNH